MTSDVNVNTDVIVIGGGLAGLAAATVAARAGARVELLEARSALGGRARTDDRNGYLFNEGAHALYRAGEGMAVLRRLGVEPDGADPPAKGGQGLLDGRLGLLPAGPASMLRTPLLDLRGKVQLAALLGRLGRVDPGPLASVPLSQWVDDVLSDPGARQLLHAVVRVSTYAHDPDHLSAGAAVTQVQRALDSSVLYLHGGWRQLVGGLRAVAGLAGVSLHSGVKVTAVRQTAGGVVVDTDAGSRRAGAVVLAAGGPAGAASLLGASVPEAACWAADARPARVAVLDVGLRRPWGDRPAVVFGIDRPLYLSVHGNSARLAPEGGTLVTVMRYLGADDSIGAAASDGHGDAVRAELEALLDQARPGWREDAAEVLFRRQLLAASDLPRAAAGGLPARPGSPVPGTDRMFVAGDWVGPDGMLADAALASAEVAGRAAALAGKGLTVAA